MPNNLRNLQLDHAEMQHEAFAPPKSQVFDAINAWGRGVKQRTMNPLSALAKASQEMIDADPIDTAMNWSNPMGGLVGMFAGKGAKTANALKTEFELAHEVAQRNAALPVEQGGLGLPANNMPMDRADVMYPSEGYHLSRHGSDVQQLDSGVFASDPFDAVGTHLGTKEAANARWDALGGRHPEDVKGVMYPVRFAGENPLLDGYGSPWVENDLLNYLRESGGHNLQESYDYRDLNKALRDKIFAERTSIPYVNDVEDVGSISHIVPPKNIRSRFAAFDPMQRNSANILAGGAAGAVGINSLADLVNQEQYQ